ncbi:MAG: nuclear transport factor 2 family protein [Mycobacterium sp.]
MTGEHSATALSDVIDREMIRDRLARLSRGLDRRDAELIRSCYWPEAIDDQAVAICSVDDVVAWVVPGDPAMVLTLHTLGQSLIDVHGDTATVETHVTAYHRVRIDDADRDVVLGGRYLDRLQKRGDQWRINHRKLLCDWHNDLGPSADWAQGLFGTPFASPNATGVAHDDPSETFLRGGAPAGG